MKFTKETFRRALRTFMQAVIAYIVVNLAYINFTDGKAELKEALIGLAISALAAGLSAVMNLEKEELGAGGKMTFDEFVKKYLGKGNDYDGSYGVQCVDLIKLYVDKVLGVKPQSIGNAIEYYNKRNSSDYLKKNFTWIKNSEKFIPKKGDICVFTSKTGHGHVSIATGEGTTTYFYSYDQNYPSGKHEPMTKIKHSYASFLGVLRPIEQESIKEHKNKPTVKAGKTYTFTTEAYVYKNTLKETFKICDITELNSTEPARLQNGTKVKVVEVATIGKNIWIKFNCYKKTAFALVYNYDKDKTYIK